MGMRAKGVSAAAVALLCMLAMTTAVVEAQDAPPAAVWSDQFLLGGFDDPVSTAVADDEGNLFVGGEFTAHNGQPMNHIAKWDGSRWSSLGDGLDGPVWSLAIDDTGSLIVGGYFNRAGEQDAPAIAKWDGQEWASIGSGLGAGEAAVSDITFDASGQLVAAYVAEAYDEPLRGFYRTELLVSVWNGSSWNVLGAARSINQTNTRPELAVDDAGLLISSAGPNLAAWDGASWTDVGPDQPNFSFTIKSLATAPTGEVLVIDNLNVVYQWSAGEWSEYSTLTVEGLRPTEIAFGSGEAVYLAAEDIRPETPERNVLLVREGDNWVPTAEVFGGAVNELVVSDSQLLVAGSFNKAGDSPGAFLAGLSLGEPSETTWAALGAGGGSGLDGAVTEIVTDSEGNAYVAGTFVRAGGVEVNGVAQWNGTSWSGLAGGTNGIITALAIDSQGDLIAAGYFSEAGGVPVSDIARWDGQAWSPVGSGFERRPDFSLGRNVEALATGRGGTIYASGYFETTGDQVAVNGLAKWNGSSWEALGDGLEGLATSLAVGPDGSLVASGSFSNGVARWNGLGWTSLGSRFVRFDPITDVAIKPDGTIIAAGSFDGNFGVAHWSGIDWVRLGPPVLPDPPVLRFELPWDAADLEDVYVLEIDSSGGVFAGGRFRSAGGQIVNHLARWDGQSWQGYAEGLDGAVTALGFGPDNKLLIGGRFVNAGGVPASRFTTLAAWRVPTIGSISDASTVEEIVAATDYDPAVHGDVLRLYQAFFHREPDVGGAKYWIGLNSDGYEIDAISKFFEATEEFNNNYGEASNEVFLGVIYLNVLGRSHDAAGFAYWLDLLETGQLTRGDVVRWIAANTEFINRFPYGL